MSDMQEKKITYDKAVDNILTAADMIAQNKISNAKFDRTIVANIIQCIDASIGKYKVKYQDGYWNAYSNTTENAYPEGTNVYVLIPSGDMNKVKTIVGTQMSTENSNLSIINQEDVIIPVGSNTFEYVGQIGLKSYHSERRIIYNNSSNNLDKIALEEYIKNSEYLYIAMDVRTNLPAQQKYNGNYGIKCYIDFHDKSEEKNIVTRTYILDIDTMQGNPYNFKTPMQQKAIFSIDSENFIEIKQMQVFCENFPNQRIGQPDDIFISNISLMGANVLSKEELDNYALYLTTPKGCIFNQYSLDTDTREIIANFRIKGQLVNNNVQKIPYYWFVQNVGITAASPYYSKYGKQGWKCLNQYNVIQDDGNGNPKSVEFIPGPATFSVKKTDLKVQRNRYKCVAIYNNVAISKEIDLINLDAQYDLTIESSNGTEFNNDTGETTLTAVLKRNNEVVSSGINWVWNRGKQGEAIQNLSVTTNVIENISINEFDDYITYSVSAFDSLTNADIGTASITLINTLYSSSFYTLVINNGSQLFKYDTWGVAPTQDESYTIPALTFTIYDRKGQPLNEQQTIYSNIQWTVPIKDTMLTFPNDYGGTPTEDGTKKIIKGQNGSLLKTLAYGIVNNFFANKMQNTIQLKVWYDNLTLVAQTDFTFIKQGDNGTNGTEYAAKLIKQFQTGPGLDWGYEKPAAFLQSNNTVTSFVENVPFLLEFWHNGDKIFTGTETGRTDENKDLTITWQQMINKYKSNVLDSSAWSLSSANTGRMTPGGFNYSSTNRSYNANIIQAAIQYDGLMYYVTNSMIMGKRNSTNYRAGLKYNSGFRQVVFGQDGKRPQYRDNVPFEIIVERNNNGRWEDISRSTDNYIPTYNWSLVGSVYNTSTSVWDNECYLYPHPYLNDPDYNSEKEKNQYYVKVIDGYDGLSLNQAVVCQIIIKNNSNTTLATLYLHIPIHMMLNRYGHQNLNDWNGNGITIDNQGGYILSPQIGAGVKHNDNSFTGIFMGKSRGMRPGESESGRFSNIRADEEIGLFGYTHGTRSIFLDAETGKAQFGTSDKAKIIIDPSQKNTAGIYSGNYDTDLGTGMAINFSQGELFNQLGPWIRFGSGNFSVDKDGYLIAKGGGSIAGWNITDQKLYKDNVGMSSSGVMSKIPITTFTKGTTRTTGQRKIVFWAGNSERQNFAVTPDGHVYMSKIQVGSSNDAKSIFINLFQGENNDSSIDRSAIFSNYKTSKDSSKDGFYLGTDGLALGPVRNISNYKIYDSETDKWITSPITVSNFQVDENGTFFAKNGYIGTDNFGWQIERDFLGYKRSTLNDYSDKNGIYLGKDGLSIGRQGTSSYQVGFKVDNQGNMYARKGQIGLEGFKWIITNGYLGVNRPTINNTDYENGIYLGKDGISIGRTTLSDGTNVAAFKVNIASGASNAAKYSMNIGSLFRLSATNLSINPDINQHTFTMKVGDFFNLTESGLSLKGYVNAASGKIGPFNIASDKIYYYYKDGSTVAPRNGKYNFEITPTTARIGFIYMNANKQIIIGSSNDQNDGLINDSTDQIIDDTRVANQSLWVYRYTRFKWTTEFDHDVYFRRVSDIYNVNFYSDANVYSGYSFHFQNGSHLSFSYGSHLEVKTPNFYVGSLLDSGSYGLSGYLGFTSNNQVVTAAPSSKRYKNHIRYLQKKDVEGLLKVQPALFIYKKESLKGWGERQGLYAQDLDENYPNAVMYGENHIPENWDPKEIIPGMLLLIQQHEKEIRRLKEIIENGKK